MIESGEHDIYVSAISIAEISIKHLLRRGHPDDMAVSGAVAMQRSQQSAMLQLPLTPEDAAALDLMPLLHGDPFDRLLVAQARNRAMILMTHDGTLAAYGDHVLVV